MMNSKPEQSCQKSVKSTKRRNSSDRVMLRVVKGGFQPADRFSADKLREKGFIRVDQIVSADIKGVRNPKFWRLAHGLGQLLVENVESFEGCNAHTALKRIQREAMIACSEMAFLIPGVGMVTQFIPDSLSFDQMDDGKFHEVYGAMCKWVVKTYFPGCTESQIEQMAEVMVNE